MTAQAASSYRDAYQNWQRDPEDFGATPPPPSIGSSLLQRYSMPGSAPMAVGSPMRFAIRAGTRSIGT